jgi:hypothetical protein
MGESGDYQAVENGLSDEVVPFTAERWGATVHPREIVTHGGSMRSCGTEMPPTAPPAQLPNGHTS